MDSIGNQSPLLRVYPGDIVWITLVDQYQFIPKNSSFNYDNDDNIVNCSSSLHGMDTVSTSVNIHFHGMNISPECHGDDVINTIVDAGQSFIYKFSIPTDMPPGLYAYHDHIHGMSDTAVLAGASGAIIVEGIENFQPITAGLPERVLILRDYSLFPIYYHISNVPSWDISLNYVPIPFPDYLPSVIAMSEENQYEFWRVVNAGADTIFNIQLLYDGIPQILQVVALDGVPLGSQDGTDDTNRGLIINYTQIFLPPLARAEFIVIGPDSSVTSAQLISLAINTGLQGDHDPYRPIANIIINSTIAAEEELYIIPQPTNSSTRFYNSSDAQRFAGLMNAPVSQNRSLYFSETTQQISFGDHGGPTNFYITVQGQTPQLFNPSAPPAITAIQGTAEDWVIENRAREIHIFHIHQIHFLLLEINGVDVSADQQQYFDTIPVTFWNGLPGEHYPTIKIRLDFRGADIGTFVYHCHILGHEDNGMMAKIEVVEPSQSASQSPKPTASSHHLHDHDHDIHNQNSDNGKNLDIGMAFMAFGIAIVGAILTTLAYRYRNNNKQNKSATTMMEIEMK